MSKKLKRIISLVLAIVIAMGCMSVIALAADADTADEEQTTEKIYDETKRFWKNWVEAFKTFWDFIRYIFYDVFRGRDSGAIPDAPTQHPVTY